MLDGDSLILLVKVVFLYPCYQTRSNFTHNYWGGSDYPVADGPQPFIYATGYLCNVQQLSSVSWETQFVQWLRLVAPVRHTQAVFSAPVDLRQGKGLISKMVFSLSDKRRWEKSWNIIVRSTTVRNLDKWTMGCLQNLDYNQKFLNFIPAALILRPIVFLRRWA